MSPLLILPPWLTLHRFPDGSIGPSLYAYLAPAFLGALGILLLAAIFVALGW